MLTIEPANNYELHLMTAAQHRGIPISGNFELTPLCNMNCRMCYIRMTPAQCKQAGGLLDTNVWLRIADEALAAGTQFFLLTGGEPLSYPGFTEIYEHLHNAGAFVVLNTNGTLIDEKMADLFRRKRPRRVNISLYGAGNEVYNELCRMPDGFDRVMRGLRLLKEAGIAVKLNYTLTPENQGELDAISKISDELQVPVSYPTYLFPPIRKAESDRREIHRLTPKESAMAKIRYYDVLFREYDREEYKTFLAQMLEEMSIPVTDPAEQEAKCGAGMRTYWVNWQGKMTSCGMLSDPTIDLTQISLEQAWQQIHDRADEITTSATCNSCRYRKVCNTCAASAFAETGDMNGVPEYHCECCREFEKSLQQRLDELDQENI